MNRRNFLSKAAVIAAAPILAKPAPAEAGRPEILRIKQDEAVSYVRVAVNGQNYWLPVYD